MSDWSFECNQGTAEIQFTQTSPALDLGGRGRLHFVAGFRRCFDFDDPEGGEGAKGQDFVAIEANPGIVVGIVADGVSQSFYGNLAAEWVGKKILEILGHEERTDQPPSQEEMEKGLEYLARETDPKIQEYTLKVSLDSPLGQALQSIRETRGSQAVFTAFWFQPKTQRLVLYLVGDAYAEVDTGAGEWESIRGNLQGRWSSRRFSREKLSLKVVTREGVEKLLIHSDGVESSWARQWDGLISQEGFEKYAQERAAIDDLSFLAMHSEESSGRSPDAPPEERSAAAGPEDALREGSSGPDRDLSTPQAGRRTFLVFCLGLLLGGLLWNAALHCWSAR